jgi:cell division protein FtsQ
MKPVVRKIILALVCAALVAGLCVLLARSKAHRQQITCKGLKVEYADAHRFVNDADIKAWLERDYGNYVGQRLDSVGLDRIENILDEQSAILKSEAWTTEDGLLNVRITQREPVLRFQKGDEGFYVDDRGYIFPLQKQFDAPVPVVDGAIPVRYTAGYKGKALTEEEQRWIGKVLDMMGWVRKSKVWEDAFVQVSVREGGDFVLTPREGKERFIFGQPEEVADKFDRIGKYYEYILPARGEGYYKTVNVKFDRQIICRQQ